MATEYTVETLITDTFGTYLTFLENVDAGHWVVYGFVMVLLMLAVFSFERKSDDAAAEKRVAALVEAQEGTPERKLTAGELAALPAPRVENWRP